MTMPTNEPSTNEPLVNFRFNPWPHQRPFFQALKKGITRFALVWHRRAGKDLCAWNAALLGALQRVGAYYHFFPTLKLGRKIIWDGMDGEGIRYRDYVPRELVSYSNDTEMKLILKNGSVMQILGAEDITRSAVGTNAVWATFSEFAAYSTEEPWNLVRPILAANHGTAVFCYTPRGPNHGHKLYELAKSDPQWFTSLLTVEQTRRPTGEPIITPQIIDQERRSGMPEEMIAQEYYCSFSGYLQGSFYSDQLDQAYREQRVTDIPWNPNYPVHTVCDLGVHVNFAGWLFQLVGQKIHVIQSYQDINGSIPQWIRYLQQKPYVYGEHFAPFDINTTDTGTGMTRLETARQLGFHFRPLPKVMAVEDRINCGRQIFPICYFDANNCADGLKALLNYRRRFNEKVQAYEAKEWPDQYSHLGASFTYLGMAYTQLQALQKKWPEYADDRFNPLLSRQRYPEFGASLFRGDPHYV